MNALGKLNAHGKKTATRAIWIYVDL